MAEFVLIPGGRYGGWVFEGIERPLLARGHVVRSVTLSGLGAQPAPAANLSTHVAGAAENGTTCAPPPGLDPRCRPHPTAAFLEAVRLTGARQTVARKVYVGAHGWEGSPFLDLFARLERNPEWTTLSLPCGHSIPRHAPERAVDVLLAAAG